MRPMGGVRYLISKSKQTHLNYYLFIARVLVWLLFINFVDRLQRVCVCVCVLIGQINIQSVGRHMAIASSVEIRIRISNYNKIK